LQLCAARFGELQQRLELTHAHLQGCASSSSGAEVAVCMGARSI
jgi:hypothetical protein